MLKTVLHSPRTTKAFGRLGLDHTAFARFPPPTKLTERDCAHLLIARFGTLCQMCYPTHLTEEEQTAISQAFAAGRVPPERLLRKAHPKLYEGLEKEDLTLTPYNVIGYLNETHSDDATPWLTVRIVSRTRKDNLCWTAQDVDTQHRLRVLNPFGLVLEPDDRAYIHATRNETGTPASGIIVTMM